MAVLAVADLHPVVAGAVSARHAYLQRTGWLVVDTRHRGSTRPALPGREKPQQRPCPRTPRRDHRDEGWPTQPLLVSTTSRGRLFVCGLVGDAGLAPARPLGTTLFESVLATRFQQSPEDLPPSQPGEDGGP